MMDTSFSARLLLALVLAVAVSQAQNIGRTDVKLSRPPNFNPVGMDYIQDFGFIVSSATYGSLYFLEDQQPVQLFSNGTGLLTHSAGVRYDSTHRLVFATNNDMPFSRHAAVVALNKKDGSLKGYWDLSDLLPSVKPKLVNDVAVDDAGNAYATDSLNGVIYKADKNGEASVFVQSSLLQPQDSIGIGANGIIYYAGASDSYLLLTRSGLTEAAGGLLRVSLSTKKVQRISIDHGNYTGAIGVFDGAVINPRSGRMFVAGYSDNSVYEFSTSDDWSSALLTAQYRVRCSTPVALQYVQSPYNDVYVLCNSGVAPYYLERVQVSKINIIPFDNTLTVSAAASWSMAATSAVLALALFLGALLF